MLLALPIWCEQFELLQDRKPRQVLEGEILAVSQKVKKCTVCEEFPSVCMLCGVCQNGGFRRDTNVETSTVFLVALRNGVLQRYELVYQLGSADSECSYFGYLGAWSHQ